MPASSAGHLRQPLFGVRVVVLGHRRLRVVGRVLAPAAMRRLPAPGARVRPVRTRRCPARSAPARGPARRCARACLRPAPPARTASSPRRKRVHVGGRQAARAQVHAVAVGLEVQRALEHRGLAQHRALRAADLLRGAVRGRVEFAVAGDLLDDRRALLHPLPHRLQCRGGLADAVLRAAQHRLVEVLAQLVQSRQQVLQVVRADASAGLAGGELCGDIGQLVAFAVELQQQADGRQRLPPNGADAVALAARVPQQQAVLAQAAEHGVELDRVQVGEVVAQLLRAPLRRGAALADGAQHQQPHHHALLAAVEEQRREGAAAGQRAEQQRDAQVGQVGRDDAGAEVVLQGGGNVVHTGPETTERPCSVSPRARHNSCAPAGFEQGEPVRHTASQPAPGTGWRPPVGKTANVDTRQRRSSYQGRPAPCRPRRLESPHEELPRRVPRIARVHGRLEGPLGRRTRPSREGRHGGLGPMGATPREGHRRPRQPARENPPASPPRASARCATSWPPGPR